VREATESRIIETNDLLEQIAALVRSGRWDLDLVVVVRRVQARSGFAAISQGTGQSVELKAIGDVRLPEILEVGGAELRLASDRSTTGFLLYDFGSRETPSFSPPIRVKHSLWDRLLPWRAEGPWLIDPTGGRHDARNLPTDLSDFAPEAQRYNPQYSAMALSELSGIAAEDLFEEVTSLPDGHGSEVGPNLEGAIDKRQPEVDSAPSAPEALLTPEELQKVDQFVEVIRRSIEERERRDNGAAG
jgi:hypothetical protein